MKCPTCDTVLPADHAVEIGNKINQYVYWDVLAYKSDGHTFVVPGLGEVTLLAKNTSTHEEMGEDRQEVFMVFEIGGRFYKKLGFGDSYGEIEWDGPFKEVVKTTKVVDTYDPK